MGTRRIQPRRHVVGIRRDCLKELKVVPHSTVDRQAGSGRPFILRVHTNVRVRLRHGRSAKRLRKPGIPVRAERKFGASRMYSFRESIVET
jgi:hypothetical protein